MQPQSGNTGPVAEWRSVPDAEEQATTLSAI